MEVRRYGAPTKFPTTPPMVLLQAVCGRGKGWGKGVVYRTVGKGVAYRTVGKGVAYRTVGKGVAYRTVDKVHTVHSTKLPCTVCRR